MFLPNQKRKHVQIKILCCHKFWRDPQTPSGFKHLWQRVAHLGGEGGYFTKHRLIILHKPSLQMEKQHGGRGKRTQTLRLSSQFLVELHRPSRLLPTEATYTLTCIFSRGLPNQMKSHMWTLQCWLKGASQKHVTMSPWWITAQKWIMSSNGNILGVGGLWL